jgi:hypothetical protein
VLKQTFVNDFTGETESGYGPDLYGKYIFGLTWRPIGPAPIEGAPIEGEGPAVYKQYFLAYPLFFKSASAFGTSRHITIFEAFESTTLDNLIKRT